jgi:cytochrome P450
MIRDLTDSLISAFKKEILKENGNDDVGSLQDIPALMSDMFEAAAATTSSALTWFILYMVLHRNVQDMNVYHIPKGTLVASNLTRVHHDEREWPEPDV